MFARAGGHAPPHAVLRGGGHERDRAGGVGFDFLQRALGGRIFVGDFQIGSRLEDRDGAEDRDPDDRDRQEAPGDERPARVARSPLGTRRGRLGVLGHGVRGRARVLWAPRGAGPQASAPPGHQHEQGEDGEQVAVLQAEREAEADLPGRDEPAGEHQPARAPSVATQEQEQRQRQPAGGDHVQVTGLGHAVGRVGEGHAGRGATEAAQSELACQQVGADEAQRPGEQEQQVVADQCGHGARPEERRGAVAEQRVREREAERVGVEGVRVEQVQRDRGASRARPRRSPRPCVWDHRGPVRCGWAGGARAAMSRSARARPRRARRTGARRA